MRSKITNKNEILDITSKIIEEEGIQNCTLRKIATNAKIALGTLYNYFPSQEALFTELFNYSWGYTINKLQSIDQEALTPTEALHVFYQLLKSDVQNRGGLGRMLLTGSTNAAVHIESDNFVLNQIPRQLIVIMRRSEKLANKSEELLYNLAYSTVVLFLRYIVNPSQSESEFLKTVDELLF